LLSFPAPCQVPRQLTAHDITAISATLEWVYDGACAAAGLVSGYRLKYTTGENPIHLEIPDVNTTMTLLEHLIPGTRYRVEVIALTIHGRNSGSSNLVEFTTKESGRSHIFGSLLFAVVLVLKSPAL